MRRKINTNVYYFKRKSNTVYDWYNQETVTQINQEGGSVPTAINLAFRLQDVPGYTDFTNVYDSYRIRAVKINLLPIGNVSSSNTSGSPTGPAGNYAVRCFSAFDPNQDGNGIEGTGSVAEIQEYQNCKWTPYNRIHKRYIKPKVTIPTFPGSAASYVNLAGKQPWIQCADGGGTLHYGLAVVVDDSGFPAGSMLYKVECTYYLQFCRPK